MANRTGKGGFKKGQSGNPGGRPKEVGEVRELARQYTAKAINTLVEIMEDRKTPPAARVAASSALLDRGYGRAPQSLEVKGTLEKSIMDMVASLDDRPANDDGEEAATKH